MYCLYVDVLVLCQFIAWPTWFIVYVLSPCRYFVTQFIAWPTWFIVSVLSPCRYAGTLSVYSMAHLVHCLVSMVCLHVGMQVSCQLMAWHTRVIVLCLHAGILSAYGMALADVVHEAQEPCALIYRSGRYSSLQHFTCLFKNSHEVCVWDKVVVVGGRGVMYINVFLLLLLLISVIRYLCDFKGRTGIKQVA